jgi:SAM-dependent methyltransferase
VAARVTHEEKVQELLKKGVINRASTVLDIGCGPGQFAVELGKVVKKVVGLDFSANMLMYAKQNAQNAGLTNIDWIKSDWDSFESDQRFDFVLASMSPAINAPGQLYKMLDLCTGYCYFSSFVERHSSLKQKLHHLTGKNYIRQFNKINYSFNLLWTRGLFPELSYEIGTYERVFSLAKAKGIFPQELGVATDSDCVETITHYLERVAENEMITEVLQQRKGELIWKMS